MIIDTDDHDTTDTDPAASILTGDKRGDARRIYLMSLKSGAPISGIELAKRQGMSERWGQDRVREVREHVEAHPDHYGADVLALASGRRVESAPTGSLPPRSEPTPPTRSGLRVDTDPQTDPHMGPDPMPHVPDEWVDEVGVAHEPQTGTQIRFAGAVEESAAAQPAPAHPHAPANHPQTDPQNNRPIRSDSHDRFAGRFAPPADTMDTPQATRKPPARRPVRVWAVWALMAPAAVAIWGGWVGLGEKAGFGVVNLLPGITEFYVNTAITLPIGMEVYAAFALYVWLSGRVGGHALTFSRWSSIISLIVGALGQVAYHVMEAAGIGTAPWWVTGLVSCLPVAVLGMGAALAHLVVADRERTQE